MNTLKWMIFCMLSFVTIHSQDNSVDNNTNNTTEDILYFQEYISSVYDKLPDIQLNKLKSIGADVNRLNASKTLNWDFEMRTGLFQESDFTGNLDSPFLFSRGWEIATSLQKTFANAGGRMNLDFSYRQFVAEGVVDGAQRSQEFFVPTIKLQYGQPLLKNIFGLLDRLPMQLANLESKIIDWTVEEENAYLLSTYKKLYMQWVVYAQIQDFLLETLTNATELETLTRQQRKVGYVDEVDFQNATMLVLEVNNQLLDVQNVYTNLLYKIGSIVGSSNITPDTKEWDLLQESLLNDSFDGRNFTETRQYLILGLMSDKLKYASKGVRNSLLPELNALVSVAMEIYSTNSIQSAPSSTFLVPAYYAGLQLKYPIGDIEYQANLTELRKNRLEYNILSQKLEQEYQYGMSEKKRNLSFFRDKIENRQAMQKALGSRYTAQYRTFSQGRGALAQLIDTKNELLRNRIEEADVQMRLIFEYFDFKAMNNDDEIARGTFN